LDKASAESESETAIRAWLKSAKANGVTGHDIIDLTRVDHAAREKQIREAAKSAAYAECQQAGGVDASIRKKVYAEGYQRGWDDCSAAAGKGQTATVAPPGRLPTADTIKFSAMWLSLAGLAVGLWWWPHATPATTPPRPAELVAPHQSRN
jgi:hypothetical protein